MHETHPTPAPSEQPPPSPAEDLQQLPDVIPAGSPHKLPNIVAEILVLGSVDASHIAEDLQLADILTPRLRAMYDLLREKPTAPNSELARQLGIKTASLARIQVRLREILLDNVPANQLASVEQQMDLATGRAILYGKSIGHNALSFGVNSAHGTRVTAVRAMGQLLMESGVDPSFVLSYALQRVYAAIVANPDAGYNRIGAELHMSAAGMPKVAARIMNAFSPYMPVDTLLPPVLRPIVPEKKSKK